MATVGTAGAPAAPSGGDGRGGESAGVGATRPVRPDRERLEALVRALALPGLGSGRLRNELEVSSDSGAAVIRRVEAGLTRNQRERARGWATRALETIDALGLHVLTPGMAAYPARLRHLPDPPYALFASGRLDLLERGPIVAVVGTRSSSRYGREAARRIAAGIAAAGVPVVSGLALGIDGAAHRAAGAGRTIAVVGSGVDVAYPRSHAALHAEIARDGLILSEQLPGAPPLPHSFPRRNRIIAALASGVVVVEAPLRSGALITARLGLDLGRTIFAVPGRIDAPASEGSNDLIRDGAHLVTGAREILSTLGVAGPEEDVADSEPGDLHGVGLALWRVLGPEPLQVDAIAGELGVDTHQILASLLSLEVLGHARQLAGMRFVRA